MNRLQSRLVTTAGVRGICCWLGPGFGGNSRRCSGSYPHPGQAFFPGVWSGFEHPRLGLCLCVSSGDTALLSSDAPTWHLLNLIENSERGKVMSGSLYTLASSRPPSEVEEDMGLHPAM